MQARYENWVERPERRLVRQPPAVLRRAVSGLVSACARTARVDYDAADRCPTRTQLPIDPSTDVPDGYRAEQRGQPGGFIGDPDVMDTWATSSLTPQIVVRLGRRSGSVRARRSRWTCGRRRTTSSARGCSRRCCASQLEHDSLPWTQRGDLRLGARSRSQEDVEVEGQRRHADGAARGARLRRRALLGGERPARAPTRRSTPAR